MEAGQKVLARLWRNGPSAPILWQIWRSGLFDADAYGDANEDIELSRSAGMLHYYKYGRFESRSSGQSVLAKWLLPKIIKGGLSGHVARKVQDIFSDGMAKAGRMNKLGLDIREYTYLQTYERQDFDSAYIQLSDLQMPFAFEQHYLFACKHMRHEHLDKAYEWGVGNLRDACEVDLPFCVALQDIARNHGFNLMPKQDMMSAMLDLLADTKLPPFMTFQQALWRLGICLVDDGSALFSKVVRLLPEPVYMRWSRESKQMPPKAAGWEAFLNTVAFNSLSSAEASLSVPNPGKREKPFHGASKQAVSEKHLNIRSLPARYWERAEFDVGTCTYLNAFKYVTSQAALYCDGLVPTQAGDIHMIDGDVVRGMPSLGYHSVSRFDRRALHFKESALPDFYLFDREGYSGWSSWKDVTRESLRAQLGSVDPHALEKFYSRLKEKFVDGRLSKYAQPEESAAPAEDYIFFALQIPDDTVLSLSWIGVEEALKTVLAHLEEGNTKLVIKRHPYDFSNQTDKLIQNTIANSSSVIVSTAAVGDLIAGAKAVITTNSGVGIEALLQLKRVITLGRSDYAAVSLNAPSIEALKKSLVEIDQEIQDTQWQSDVKRFLYAYFFESCFTSDRYPASFEEQIEALFVEITG